LISDGTRINNVYLNHKFQKIIFYIVTFMIPTRNGHGLPKHLDTE